MCGRPRAHRLEQGHALLGAYLELGFKPRVFLERTLCWLGVAYASATCHQFLFSAPQFGAQAGVLLRPVAVNNLQINAKNERNAHIDDTSLSLSAQTGLSPL